ncbi:hypothetical protein [Williamsia muralis]|uniref:hypothetical protein n=1 Tax=Williamsia marianensis TaxID=85044 RepID=UPI0038251EFA
MYETPDGYLRITSGTKRPTRESSPTGASLSLLYIDLDVDRAMTSIDDITQALQSASCGSAATILFRWSKITTLDSDQEPIQIAVGKFLEDAAKSPAVGRSLWPQWLGVITFRIGGDPIVTWVQVDSTGLSKIADNPNSDDLLNRALRVELDAMFTWGHAIWRPTDYHYELPSGEHSDVFVKVSDAFRTPRDAIAAATWLSHKIVDDMKIIADNASLMPLVLAIALLSETAGFEQPKCVTLDDYPATRLSVFTALKTARQSANALILLSVNASGRHLDLIEEAAQTGLSGVTKYSIVVIADKNLPWKHSSRESSETTTSWLGLSEQIPNPLDSSNCSICKTSERSQIVKIDPRSFEALALPGANLVMPDVSAAAATRDFWTACYSANAVSVLADPDDSPSTAARGKSEMMNVRVSISKVLEHFKNDSAVLSERLNRQLDGSNFRRIDSIVVSQYESDLNGFSTVVEQVKLFLEKPDLPVIAIDASQSPAEFSSDKKAEISRLQYPLILSIGTVSGWNLRQMLVAIQQCWHENSVKGAPAGLVLHSRPAKRRQWENLHASFSKNLHYLWQTFIPSISPLDDERLALSGISGSADFDQPTRHFFDQRRKYCSPQIGPWDERLAQSKKDVNVPDPRFVLWGLPSTDPQLVRNESLYGTRVDALTAYVAVGAAMHSQRENASKTDPRWPMFDFDSISRSYYDGILVASMLRWARPSECWWGDTSHLRSQAVTNLIARTRDINDQRVLFPELLLAAYQGKLPREAVQDVLARITTDVSGWAETIDRGPVSLGVVLARRAISLKLRD